MFLKKSLNFKYLLILPFKIKSQFKIYCFKFKLLFDILNRMENLEYDVMIIGGGLAGLTATYFSLKAGKKLILIEKCSKTGGNSSIILFSNL